MINGDDYITAAYLVFLALVLIYVVIMAVRQVRLARELAEIEELLARREQDGNDDGGARDREMTAA